MGMNAERWGTAADQDLTVTTMGRVPPAHVTRAVRTVGRILYTYELDAAARVRITAPPTPEQPNIAQVNVHGQGLRARVQVTGPRGFAITFAAERLDTQLSRLLSGDGSPRPWPDPARHALTDVTEPRPIVRHKKFLLARQSPVEAVAEMDACDYDAHLFREATTGADAVVYRREPDGYAVMFSVPTPATGGDAGAAEPRAALALAPHLEESQAVDLLCTQGIAHLFYVNPADGRGRLLYRRYDGDLAQVAGG